MGYKYMNFILYDGIHVLIKSFSFHIVAVTGVWFDFWRRADMYERRHDGLPMVTENALPDAVNASGRACAFSLYSWFRNRISPSVCCPAGRL